MVTTYSNGFGSSLVVIRENGGLHTDAYPDTSVARRRRRHLFAAILLVLVFFLGSAAHLVVRISGKRHLRHRQDYHQQEQNAIVSSDANQQQESFTDSRVNDFDETNPLSPSHDISASNKNMPEKPISLDMANQQALADSLVNTASLNSSSLGSERNDTTKRDSPRGTNSSIPVDNQQHKAS